MVFTLAAKDLDSTINLNNVSVNVFLTALENIAALRTEWIDHVTIGVPGGEPFPPTR